ncbi:MAG: hypothetical protein MMC23_007988 [Stictis urceolatum]|nr:hypothetical protein [Stictis urceolata]
MLRRLQASLIPQAKELDHIDDPDSLPEPTALVKEITSALPDRSFLPQDVAFFKDSMNRYWAQQECEVVPSCVIQPRDATQLSKATTILKQEHDRRGSFSDSNRSEKLFAIRAGGHSPVAGAASIKNGVSIDLSHLREVKLSEDRSTVTIGAGAKWTEVSETLDAKGLAVVGGRNSAVGVGRLILEGGISFFSPRFGMVCSNIIDYEVVLADGTVVTASSSTNPDL